jgi:hypothetical protein
MRDLWWTKWHWGRFSPSISVSLPILVPPIAPHSSSGAGRTGQIEKDVPSGSNYVLKEDADSLLRVK